MLRTRLGANDLGVDTKREEDAMSLHDDLAPDVSDEVLWDPEAIRNVADAKGAATRRGRVPICESEGGRP